MENHEPHKYGVVRDYFLSNEYKIVTSDTIQSLVKDSNIATPDIIVAVRRCGLTVISVRVTGHKDLDLHGYIYIPDKQDQSVNTDAIDQQLNFLEEKCDVSDSFLPLEIVRMAAAYKPTVYVQNQHATFATDMKMTKAIDKVTEYASETLHQALDKMTDNLDKTFDERIYDQSIADRCRAWSRKANNLVYVEMMTLISEHINQLAKKLSEAPKFIISTRS